MSVKTLCGMSILIAALFGTTAEIMAADEPWIIADDCRFTCTVEATQSSTIELHSSVVDPYPFDPTGAYTRFGAYAEYVEDDVLGAWSDADPRVDYRLQTTLTDGLGRTLVGNLVVPGSNPRVR